MKKLEVAKISLPSDVKITLATLIALREQGKPYLANLVLKRIENRAQQLGVPPEEVLSYFGNIDDPDECAAIYDRLNIIPRYRQSWHLSEL